MNDGARLAEAASAFVGTPFRLHGRDPSTGLDCVGLVAASLSAIGHRPTVPRGYRLRNASIDQWLGAAARSGFFAAAGPIRPGDLLLLAPGPSQSHLLIVDHDDRVIHAHAGLGRVVRHVIAQETKPLMQWRLAPIAKDT